jgi:hypothetical protein
MIGPNDDEPNCLECEDDLWFEVPCECCGGWETDADDSNKCQDCDGSGVLHEPCFACNPEGDR